MSQNILSSETSEVIRNVLIPGEDGELAADLFLPKDRGPHPVLVCYYPYHKDDLIGSAYEFANRYFASRGFATLLVDFRGLGNSSGVAREAMHEDEAKDGSSIIAWAAEQPWSDGSVGMWGLSYGGITALKTAAARPDALKAIIPMMATEDIYADWFYPGGCSSMLGAFGVWGPMMLSLLLMPPTYRDNSGRWLTVWRRRLEEAHPFMLDWQSHRDQDDDYWTRKRIAIEDIEVPTFLIGGWRDIFPEAMTRIFARLCCEKQLLMGPWLHVQPDSSPTIPVEHLDLMCSWWDQWLRDGPASESPDRATYYVQGLGWHSDQDFPPQASGTQTLHLNADARLDPVAGDPDVLEYRTDPTVGMASGLWDPLGTGIGLPRDQRTDDVRSLSFTNQESHDGLTITGRPKAWLTVSRNSKEELNLVAKLSAIDPSGHSHLITTGWLHVPSTPETSERKQTHRVDLWSTAFRMKAGHRLRLSVACSDFPRIWPTPSNPHIQLHVGEGSDSRIEIPLEPEGKTDIDLAPADPDLNRAPLAELFAPWWVTTTDATSGAATVEFALDSSLRTPAGQSRVELWHRCTTRVEPDQPALATARATNRIRCSYTDSTIVDVRSTTRTTRQSMDLEGTIYIDGQLFYSNRWQLDTRRSSTMSDAES